MVVFFLLLNRTGTMVHNPSLKRTATVIMFGISILIATLLNARATEADNFDLKTTLLKHREQHTNHLNVRYIK